VPALTEVKMLIQSFSQRAAEYIRLAQRARSDHDRDLCIAMARAWCGVKEDEREDKPPRLH
jgi:hypothetical protein